MSDNEKDLASSKMFILVESGNGYYRPVYAAEPTANQPQTEAPGCSVAERDSARARERQEPVAQ